MVLFINQEQEFEKLKFEYEMIADNIKYNSTLAHIYLGLTFPASSYLLYIVIFSTTISFFLAFASMVTSMFIAIAGYAIHARVNYSNEKYIVRSKQIEKEIGKGDEKQELVIWRLEEPEKLSPEFSKLRTEIAKLNAGFFGKIRINDWFKVSILGLFLAWIIVLIMKHIY